MRCCILVHDVNCTDVIWVVNAAFILLSTFYFNLPCRSKKSNIFRARNWCYFLLKYHALFWCLVIAHYIMVLALQWFKNARSFQCTERHFPSLEQQLLNIRSNCRSRTCLPHVPFGSHLEWAVLSTLEGEICLSVFLGEKEGIWVTDAFWNCFFCTFQLLKVPWHESVSFF